MLGVVGLVIGGIWIAAAAVTENIRASSIKQDILVAVSGIQSLISSRDAASLGIGENVSPAVAAAGAVSKNWIYDGDLFSGFGGFKGPWGGNVNVNTFPPGVALGGFRIFLYSVPKSTCIRLTREITAVLDASGNSLGFINLQISSSNSPNSDIVGDIDPDEMPYNATATECAGDGTNLMMFTFAYSRSS